MKKRNLVPFLFYIAILGGALWLMISIFGGVGNKVAYSEVLRLFENEQVQSFVMARLLRVADVYLALLLWQIRLKTQ